MNVCVLYTMSKRCDLAKSCHKSPPGEHNCICAARCPYDAVLIPDCIQWGLGRKHNLIIHFSLRLYNVSSMLGTVVWPYLIYPLSSFFPLHAFPSEINDDLISFTCSGNPQEAVNASDMLEKQKHWTACDLCVNQRTTRYTFGAPWLAFWDLAHGSEGN